MRRLLTLFSLLYCAVLDKESVLVKVSRALGYEL